MTKYPEVLSEDVTIDRALAGASLARYGDWELEIARGIDRQSQSADPKLQDELRAILLTPSGNTLPCIPNVFSDHGRKAWLQWAEEPWVSLYDQARTYGSNFCTRPDSAPWINRPDYWAKVRALWQGKDTILIHGSRRSLTADSVEGASRLRVIPAPAVNAYAEVDRLETEIGDHAGPVLICLGATATALAARLGARGQHGLDLGHIGMHGRRAGAFPYVISDLSLPSERKALAGKSVKPYRKLIDAWAEETGSSKGSLVDYAMVWRVMPWPGDLVFAINVFEQAQLECLPELMGHFRTLAAKAAFVVVALDQGRIKKNGVWWTRGFEIMGWTVARSQNIENKELRLWLKR